MRKILIPTLLIILCMGMTSLQAQHRPTGNQMLPKPFQTSLTITSDHQAFWVFIDDVQQNETPARSVRIERVPNGEHYLRVEMDNSEHITFGQYVVLDQSGSTYRIERQRHLYGFALNYGVPRPEQVVSFLKATPVPPQHSNQFGNHQMENGHHHGDHPHHPGAPEQMHPQPALAPAPMAMNEIDFQRALSVIQSEDFENTKLSTAKQVASNNLLTVSQISRICQLFEFDNNKLDFAKTAYFRCVDQNQYYLLHSVFTFDNSKKELDKFVQQQQ